MTPREHECLAFIEIFIERNVYSPSLLEIALGLGAKSKSFAFTLVDSLIDQGRLTKTAHRYRSIQLADPAVACTACEDTLMEGDWKVLNGAQVCIAAQPCTHCNGGADTVSQRKAKAA